MQQQTGYNKYCQSCGMPLRFDVEEYLGTNDDLSRSDEYCYYCLKNGEYTVDIPMEQMIDIWIKYTDKYNEYSDTEYTPRELRLILNKRLPTLKRWKQKQTTQDIHHASVHKIKEYIDRNLEKDVDMETLCRIANLSLFHLRRVFKNMTGENIGSYIQRLRLEYVADRLISTPLPVNEILKQSNYQTKNSLAKAFRKHFGLSMTAYRKRHQKRMEAEIPTANLLSSQTAWIPEIKKLNSQTAVCYSVGQAFRNKKEYSDIWKKLIHYKQKHIRKEDAGPFISISLDNPQITPVEQCRFYIGILTTGYCKPTGTYCLQEIPGGLYAIFKHKGSYASLPELYRYIYEQWIPQSEYTLCNSTSFEIYLTTPVNTDISELFTEIYIPIKKHSNR